LKSGVLSWSEDKLGEWILENPGQAVLTIVSEFFFAFE
jgi:hypothetical protein